MGRNHARVLHSLDGVDLVAVVDSDGDRYEVRRNAQLLDSLVGLSALEPNIAIVATPTSAHEDVVLELFHMGCHVLVEKPIAHSVEAGRRMDEAATAAGLHGAVGHIERFNPAIQELRSKLQAGEIGEVYQIATRRQGGFPERIADVGVTKDLATHDLDFTSWIAGSGYEQVFAQSQSKTGRSHEDLIAVTGRLNNGIIVNHLVNWLSPMKERTVVVTGDRGTLVADTLTSDLTLFENGAHSVDWDNLASFRGVSEGNVTRYALDKREPLRIELEAFRDLVTQGASLTVSFQEATQTLAVAEAIVSSSRTGAPVFLAT